MSDADVTPEAFVEGDQLTVADWTEALREGVLLGQRCSDCEYGTATAAAACPECGSRDLTVVVLPEEGEVFSETHINVAPPEFEAPYTIAIVTLSDGTRVTAHIEDDVAIGDTVSFKGALDGEMGPAPVFE